MGTFVIASGTIDGEVKINQVGDLKKKVANFRLATNPGWFSIAAWEKVADQVPASGFVIVTGKLSTRSYDKDGTKVYVTEIVASSVEVVGAAAPEVPADPLFAD